MHTVLLVQGTTKVWGAISERHCALVREGTLKVRYACKGHVKLSVYVGDLVPPLSSILLQTRP